MAPGPSVAVGDPPPDCLLIKDAQCWGCRGLGEWGGEGGKFTEERK